MVPKDPAVPSGAGALGSYGNMMNGSFLDNIHNSFWATGMGYGAFGPGWGSGGSSSLVAVSALPKWAQVVFNSAMSGGQSTFTGAEIVSISNFVNLMNGFKEFLPGLFYEMKLGTYNVEAGDGKTVLVVGLDMEIFYKDNKTGLTEFQIIQTVTTNYLRDKGLTKEFYTFNDPPKDGSLFYYPDQKEADEHRKIAKEANTDMHFFDGISRTWKIGTTWDAELSIVGKDAMGQYVPIYNIRYGFGVSGSIPIPHNIQVNTPALMTSYHLNSINGYVTPQD